MKPFYQFQFSLKSEKEFAALEKYFQKRILDKLQFFEASINPLQFAKKLVGCENRYRFRIGDYRVIVAKKDEISLVILVILKVAHRREVYE